MRPLEDMPLMAGVSVDMDTGRLARGEGAGNWVPAPVRAGDVLEPAEGVLAQVACYAGDIPDELVYTYSYQAESVWLPYRGELSRQEFSREPFVCSQDGLVRVCVRNADGFPVADGARLGDLVRVGRTDAGEPPAPPFLEAAAEAVASRVEEGRQEGDLALLLVSDVHWAAGCPWDDTLSSLRRVSTLVRPDALVQLGDLTDGLAPARVTREVVTDLLGDLGSCGVPVLSCVGNHDANYFQGNPDSFSPRERSQLYLGRGDPSYLVDFAPQRVRAIFLDSFEPTREERYGFSLKTLLWCARALWGTPRGWGVVVFSHVPLLAEMHVWSDSINLGEPMRRLLQAFDRSRRGALIAYVHGHNHADQVSLRCCFPVVSVGCAKLEDFGEHKPEGSVTPHRRLGDASQELWDVLVVSAERREARFVRFGAGEDRVVRHA